MEEHIAWTTCVADERVGTPETIEAYGIRGKMRLGIVVSLAQWADLSRTMVIPVTMDCT